MNERDLERLIDGAVKALPAPQAPASLLPRIMAAVQLAPLAPSSGWTMWRPPVRIAALVGLTLLAAAAALVFPEAVALGARTLLTTVALVGGDVAPHLGPVLVLARAAGGLWQLVVAPVAADLVLLVCLMGIACAALGAALGRVALGGAVK